MQISEENSEKELINLCNESHVTLSVLRLYKGEKEQQDCDDTTSESVSSKVQKNSPRKSFQNNEDKGVESAMMCWENLEDSEQEEQRRKMICQDEDTNDDKEKQNNEKDVEEHVRSTVYMGNQLKILVKQLKLGAEGNALTLATQETLKKFVYITDIQEKIKGTTNDA